MKNFIYAILLSFLLSSCGTVVLEGKYVNLPESTQSEIIEKYNEMVLKFKSNEAKKLESVPTMEDMDRIDTATSEQFNKFKELYKNIDFGNSVVFCIHDFTSTDGTCY